MCTKQKAGIVVFLAAAIALAGCGEKFRREKQIETEVVSESSASGVTSTLVAPGETAPPLAGTAPLTGTNADTTTAFTILDANVSTSSTVDPGSLAGTLPLPGWNDPASQPPSSPPVISIERSTPAPTTTQAEPAAAAEPVPAVSSEPTAPAASAPAQPSSESEPAEEEPESSEPSPSPPPPENTSTSTATNPD